MRIAAFTITVLTMEAVGSSETSSHFHNTIRRGSENNRFTKWTMTGEKMRGRQAEKHKDCVILDQLRSVLISHPLPPAIVVKRHLQQINAHCVLSRNGIG
jgi:hypothetical protein